uniref:RING-type E3 ubiquitin transferase n=1 Tax=Lotharella globosa TaxID=91324 RepID=A0A7S4DZL7_9EUKA
MDSHSRDKKKEATNTDLPWALFLKEIISTKRIIFSKIMMRNNEFDSKVKICEYWKKGHCANRGKCTFLHAWIDPSKNTLCQYALKLKCLKTAANCQYQHLPIPVKELEAISESARSFEDVKKKVQRRYDKSWDTLIAEMDTKMKENAARRKVHMCTEWGNGTCTKELCCFVHAWVRPGKRGICQDYLNRECYNRSCPYQHLDMTLEEYETLSKDTKSYEDMLSKLDEDKQNLIDAHREAAPSNYTKIQTCSFWKEHKCSNVKCNFLHAWVDPEKKGMCANHMKGRCAYSGSSCYYQHINIPIEKYEELAADTWDYAELSKKVEAYEWEIAKPASMPPESKDVPLSFRGPQPRMRVPFSNPFPMPMELHNVNNNVQSWDPNPLQPVHPEYPRFRAPMFGLSDPTPPPIFGRPSVLNSNAETGAINPRVITAGISSPKRQDEAVPEVFKCPISLEIMVDPVTTVLGHTYERKCIEQWLQRDEHDPLTNEKLPSKQLIPARIVKSRIEEWKQRTGYTEKKSELYDQEKFKFEPKSALDGLCAPPAGVPPVSLSFHNLLSSVNQNAAPAKDEAESIVKPASLPEQSQPSDTSDDVVKPPKCDEDVKAESKSWEQKPMAEWTVADVARYPHARPLSCYIFYLT